MRKGKAALRNALILGATIIGLLIIVALSPAALEGWARETTLAPDPDPNS